MLTMQEAQELFDQLMELIEEPEFRARLSPAVLEVRAAIARGKPAVGQVKVAGSRKREVVRRVEPLDPVEQLEILVSALEFTLVIPVDLARATMEGLASDGSPALDLVFEPDSAEDATSDDRAQVEPSRPDRISGASRVVVAASQVDAATDAVEPLRVAIRAIQVELRS